MRLGFLRCSVALLGLLTLSSSRAQADIQREVMNGREVVARQILVRFRPGAVQGKLAVATALDADRISGVGAAGVTLFHSRSKTATALLKVLAARGDVEYAEPDYIIRLNQTPNDTYFNQLWGMQNTGQSINGISGKSGADIHAASAWDITTGSTNSVVAVVDTGIDYTHPDLKPNVWTNGTAFSVTIGGVTQTCPVGSHGYNAITNTFDPLDDNDHGSHTSGTIGAAGNNGAGVTGVNWTASIMGCKFLDASGSGSLSAAINAIEFAVQAKLAGTANVRVLSNSWGGGGFSQSLLDEINRANANNMLFVAAAGNSGLDNDTNAFYPADYSQNAPNVIAVAATDQNDGKASFSNYGKTTVALGAPGTNILSTVRGGYAYYDGTSMATPHVSGAAALVLAANPTLDVAGVKAAILNNVDPVASMNGVTITGGRLNVFKAVQSVANPVPDFSIAATPASQTVAAGNPASYGVSTAPKNGFSGTVSLSVTGAPSGVTASLSPTWVAAGSSSTLTVSTGSTTPAGSYTLTITGTSGTLSHSATVTLVVTQPDFSIAATPASQTVSAGGLATYSVSTAVINGFAGTVSLSVTGAPTGVTASLSPTSVAAGGSSTLSVATASSTTAGSYTLTITGTSGSLTHTTTVTLVVSQPDFGITVSPSSQSVSRGHSVSYTATITGKGGFSGTVALSVTGLPSGTTAAFSPANVTGSGSSTMTIKTASSTPRGTYTLTIKGVSGTLSHTAAVTMRVTR